MSEIEELHEKLLAEHLTTARILVVDDEPGMRNFMVKTLEPYCKLVEAAQDTQAASRLLSEQYFDVMILDNVMPEQQGIEWLAEERRKGGFTDTILVTAFADLKTAIDALRAGASDFILKPFRTNQLLNAISRSLEMSRLRRENALLLRELDASDIGRKRRHELIGSSKAITEIRETLNRVRSVSTPVLFTGASGTGKEVAARHLHATSDRADKPFVPISCGSIPADMIEVELFGYAPEAFPGTKAGREGLLASAQGGTVFLDHVSELGPGAQSALLRVLDDGMIRPIGTERNVQLDLRFLFATSKSLAAEVAAGRFREDLLFRINVVEIAMPPLSRRESDLIELAGLFLDEISTRLGLPMPEIDSVTRGAMLRHSWPGNIRELRNFVERSLIFDRFPIETLETVAETHQVVPLDEVERREILRALEAVGGNRTEAAKRLGVSRKTIDRKCAAWGL